MTVPLGPETAQWSPDCNFTLPTGLCGKPAISHVMVDPAPENVFTCAEHAPVLAQWPIVDMHKAEAVCVIPGTLWDFENGRCFLEGLDLEFPAELEAVR